MSAMTSSALSNSASPRAARGSGSAAMSSSQVASSVKLPRTSDAARLNSATRSGLNCRPACFRITSRRFRMLK